MFPRSILPLFLLCSVAFAAEYSPVLLFGGSGEAVPALSLVSSEQFLGLAHAENAMNVIFVEKNAKPENFLECTTSTGETCFSGLKTIEGKNYYRQVDSPIETIKKNSGNCQVLNTNANGELTAPLDFAPNSCVIVNLFGGVKTHDALITKFIQDNKANNIVVLYTPNVSLSRKARAVPAGTVYYTSQEPGFAIYYEKLQLCTLDDKKTTCKTLTSSGLTITHSNTTSIGISLATDDQAVSFNVALVGGYFEMHSLQLGEKTFRVLPEVQSPTTFSYYCGNKTFYQYSTDPNAPPNTLSLVFNNLQMQAPFDSKIPVDDKFAFGDPWHCVPFVSIPILAGLFVCAILLAILGVGICWLMDINTMDRFDDPKGKTITINASEG
ncbi:ATP6AP1 family protein [Megaselia abdita]